ncbi:hypothetical protein Taro_023280 [Colocasia esculenta]|uniref:Uncharacterized protein n=1 Tax=Colocasia esculenta TaxID=4460 RepID=A0A843VE05_COLES|nr:hypothetical protein [Colocasia esculenta]
MKADCPEGNKEKHINHKKEFHKKINKAMVATWSDDESSDCNETSDENEVCFMAGSSEEQVDISFELFTIEDWQEAYGISRFCHGSVDTPIDGVDTGSKSLKLFHEDRVKCVDTVPGSVDTRPSLQKTQLLDWDSVSTQPVAVSTLDPASRRHALHKWDSVLTHSLVVSTHSG